MSSDGSSIIYRRAGTRLSKRDLRAFAGDLQEHVAGGRPFTCMITDDRELARLNRMFLGKDTATDVLSFPSGTAGSIGELAISAERARQQADEFGHTEFDEIRILMLHGVLHLIGMDHEKDGGAMARAERRWRQKFELPSGLIERTRRLKEV